MINSFFVIVLCVLVFYNVLSYVYGIRLGYRFDKIYTYRIKTFNDSFLVERRSVWTLYWKRIGRQEMFTDFSTAKNYLEQDKSKEREKRKTKIVYED